MRKFEGYEPRYIADIEEIVECAFNCLLVDGIIVPHCDCDRHVSIRGYQRR